MRCTVSTPTADPPRAALAVLTAAGVLVAFASGCLGKRPHRYIDVDSAYHEALMEARIEAAKRVLADRPSHTHAVSKLTPGHNALVIEPSVALGVNRTRGVAFTEASAGMLVGGRVWRAGGGGDTPAIEHGLSALLDLAALVVTEDVKTTINDRLASDLSYRIGVALQYDRVATVAPLPDRRLRQGLRTVARLSAGVVLGKREAVEVGLNVQPIDWLGVYGRAGVDFTGSDRAATVSGGVELGPVPSLYVYAVPLAAAILYGLGVLLIKAQPSGEPTMLQTLQAR